MQTNTITKPEARPMNWSNLPNNKCPKCGKDFMIGLKVENGIMLHPCDFKISETKYAELSAKIKQQSYEKQPRVCNPEEEDCIEY